MTRRDLFSALSAVVVAPLGVLAVKRVAPTLFCNAADPVQRNAITWDELTTAAADAPSPETVWMNAHPMLVIKQDGIYRVPDLDKKARAIALEAYQRSRPIVDEWKREADENLRLVSLGRGPYR